ncbi:hypothetical protein [Cohnella caldifontis]|uniref:hypothetical protein n=1 Tax=Cohnella caldifontis TaxID=3027471 RepID=UPI0023EE14ED|nr:hypothetical protein [Cohnella sp. YIM B05605]
MKRKTAILLVTAAGLLATSAAANASGLTSKVSGLLRKDVVVSIDGTETGIQPVFIDGKAYLPAREAADALGYRLTWSEGEGGKQIILEDEADFALASGIIASIKKDEDGSVTIEFLGRSQGAGNWIMFKADGKSEIADENGEKRKLDDLKEGQRITVEYGPAVALSFPPQAYANKITVGTQRFIREEAVGDVNVTDEGVRVSFGSGEGAAYKPDLVLNAGKESAIVNAQGQSLEWSDLKKGMKIRAYYGPVVTKSIPPQSPIDTIVVLDEVKAEQK